MSDRYEAVVTREGDWWLATVRGLEGAHIEARTSARLDRYLREVIVLAADLPDEAMDGVEIEWWYELGAPESETKYGQVRPRSATLEGCHASSL